MGFVYDSGGSVTAAPGGRDPCSHGISPWNCMRCFGDDLRRGLADLEAVRADERDRVRAALAIGEGLAVRWARSEWRDEERRWRRLFRVDLPPGHNGTTATGPK